VSVTASIVIPVFNKAELTLRCLEALAAHTPEHLYEVILVDNASTDGTAELLAGLGGDVAVVTNDENAGYTIACNQGAARAAGKYLVFLNNDTEPQPGWLEALIGAAEAERTVGAVGAMLVYPDGRLQEAGGLVFRDGSGWNYGRGDDPGRPEYQRPAEVDYCSGAALLVRADLFRRLGGFDERYAPAYYEDTDLCFGLRSIGATVVYEPGAVVVHHEGGTAGTDLGSGFKRFQAVNQAKFLEKWADALARQDEPPTVTGEIPRSADRGARGLAAPVRAEVREGGPRLLVVDPFLPLHDRNSGSLRLFELLKAMVGAGLHVTFAARQAAGQDRYAAELTRLGVSVRPGAPGAELGRLLREERFDLAWLDFYDLAEQYLPEIRRADPATRVVVDTIDVHYLREQRQAELTGDPGLLRRALETRRRERAIYRQADALVAITDADRAVVSGLAPGVPVHVVPNVHAARPPGPGFAGRSGLVFVGNFLHVPNVDAVAWMLQEILPALGPHRPTLTVVGANPPDPLVLAAGPEVRFTGHVPSTAPLLDAARVSVAPLRFGAGMKGKIGEAMAAGLPVVTTPVGAEGMGLEHGRDVLVAGDAAEFAGAVAALHTDEALWTELSEAGRALVAARWSPDAAAANLERVLRDVLGAHSPSAS
jgi:GT2 family glycosyltransferase/glycosyltransferase involved in cell wall biosynthesis